VVGDSDSKWHKIAERRIGNILRSQVVARLRTLEQKICDAGPYNQRPNPHYLNDAKNRLLKQGKLVEHKAWHGPWFYLPDTPQPWVEARLEKLIPIVEQFQRASQRTGQCLERAIYNALLKQNKMHHFGAFPDGQTPDRHGLYRKVEPPPMISGRRLPGDQKVDFIVIHPTAGAAAIEAKNIREWLYPSKHLVLMLIRKAICLDCVPVLIARRVQFTTFRDMSSRGVVFHETYNQLIDERDRAIADQAKDKSLLGYHDIRIGADPDDRLLKFIGTDLYNVLPQARENFERNKTWLKNYVSDP